MQDILKRGNDKMSHKLPIPLSSPSVHIVFSLAVVLELVGAIYGSHQATQSFSCLICSNHPIFAQRYDLSSIVTLPPTDQFFDLFAQSIS